MLGDHDGGDGDADRDDPAGGDDPDDEVILQNVNETVTGVNAANQVVSPDPSVTTPVTAPAHMRIIFHVDTNGAVRLLKGVAMVNHAK